MGEGGQEIEGGAREGGREQAIEGEGRKRERWRDRGTEELQL